MTLLHIISNRIHGAGIFTCIYHKHIEKKNIKINQIVGKYTIHIHTWILWVSASKQKLRCGFRGTSATSCTTCVATLECFQGRRLLGWEPKGSQPTCVGNLKGPNPPVLPRGNPQEIAGVPYFSGGHIGLIRAPISWGGVGFGGVPLDCQDFFVVGRLWNVHLGFLFWLGLGTPC